MLRSRVPPLRLQAGAARGRHHNGLLVTSDLREMTATRPVTTPNFHLRHLAQSPPTTTTRHTKTGVCSTPHNNKKTPRPQTPHRGQGSIATTRATCDVRAELRLVHWFIGRGGVVTAQRRRSTTAGWGRICFRRSSARTAPFCVAFTTATFSESRFFHAFFSRHAAGSCSCGGRRLALCTWPTGQGA